MIIQIATTVVFCGRLPGDDRDHCSGSRGGGAADRCGEAAPDSEPGRCVRVLGCAPERARQQALRVITGRERRFPPTVDAKGYGPITEPELRKGCLARFSQG